MGKVNSNQLGLIGYPVGQSLSPALHLAALQHAGLSGDYRLYPIPHFPEGERKMSALLGKIKAGTLDGVNVTIPHKQTVIPFLDELSETAQTIGAVNTISRSGDKLVGDNTDAPGFLIDLNLFLDSCSMDIVEKHALILGAGGSARAVCFALRQDGWKVTIASRRIEQGEELRRDLDAQTAISLNKRNLTGVHPDLIVNTTPVGMYPRENSSPWPEGLPFPKHTAVYDLVYKPADTNLIQQACTQGLPATNGLGMLVEQARLAFQIWTGQLIDREVMLSAIDTPLIKESS
ncbi:MAG: shikimate dehydrogenase [Anaerolineales bacterium]|jgi:shikimate dehydrogenase